MAKAIPIAFFIMFSPLSVDFGANAADEDNMPRFFNQPKSGKPFPAAQIAAARQPGPADGGGRL
jgi:hypothetical protein